MPKRLLLHTCCAPCLSQCLNVLTGLDSWEKCLTGEPDFAVTVFYDNPNLFPEAEFDKRRAAVLQLIQNYSGVAIVADRSVERREDWKKGAQPWKKEPEKGLRCHYCYEFRLRETFMKAKDLGYEAVATTLTLSPLKDAVKINEIGQRLSAEYDIEYIQSDFKKNGGFQKSMALSIQYGIYRQIYCGCEYSIRGVS